MPRKRYSVEQIMSKLREAEVELSRGATTPEACRKIGVSTQTFYRWRKEYGGLKIDQAKRFKELERENGRLKKLVADQALDISILKEVSSGNFEARPDGGVRWRTYARSWAYHSGGRAGCWDRHVRHSGTSRA